MLHSLQQFPMLKNGARERLKQSFTQLSDTFAPPINIEQNKEQQYIILVNDIRCLARNTVDFLQRRNAINP